MLPRSNRSRSAFCSHLARIQPVGVSGARVVRSHRVVRAYHTVCSRRACVTCCLRAQNAIFGFVISSKHCRFANSQYTVSEPAHAHLKRLCGASPHHTALVRMQCLQCFARPYGNVLKIGKVEFDWHLLRKLSIGSRISKDDVY